MPLDPLALQNTEVFRGVLVRCASARRRSGGVVDVTNNRILDRRSGSVAWRPSLRSAVTSVDSGWESGPLLDAGAGNVAVARRRLWPRRPVIVRSRAIPIWCRPSPAPRASAGGSRTRRRRARGAASGGSLSVRRRLCRPVDLPLHQRLSRPGIASADSQQHNQLEQTKIMSKGEYRPDATAISAVRYSARLLDYRHDEIDLNQTAFGNFQTIGATFKNRQTEGKLEVESQPVATRSAR